MIQVTITDNYVEHTCLTCGVKFFISSEHDRGLHLCKNNFYCPSGHHQNYTKSDAERIQEKLDEVNAANNALKLDRDRQSARAFRAEEALAKKTKRKVAVKK